MLIEIKIEWREKKKQEENRERSRMSKLREYNSINNTYREKVREFHT